MSDCLFCGIADGSIKASIVYQDDRVVAFHDIGPKAPVHVLIIPRKHIAGVMELTDDDNVMIGHIFNVAGKVAKQLGIADTGFRVVVNSGAEAGQSVFHIHYHLLGGRKLGWPPG